MIKKNIILNKKLEKLKNDLLANGIKTEAFIIHYESEVHPEFELNFKSIRNDLECVGISVYDNEFYILPSDHIIYWTPGILQLIAKFVKYFYKNIVKIKIYWAKSKNKRIKLKMINKNSNGNIQCKNNCSIKGNNNVISNFNCTIENNRGIACSNFKGNVEINNKKEF